MAQDIDKTLYIDDAVPAADALYVGAYPVDCLVVFAATVAGYALVLGAACLLAWVGVRRATRRRERGPLYDWE